MRKYSWLLALLVFVLPSCQKDLSPEDSLDPQHSITNKVELDAWDAGFMDQFRTAQVYNRVADIQSDFVNATVQYGNYYGDIHKWTINSRDRDISTIWSGYYAGLKGVNFFLDNVDKQLPKLPDEDQRRSDSIIDVVKSHAYFLRAYYHFQLAVRFSRTYEPTELCVPLAITYDPNALLPRNTQKEVFDQILADLDAAADILGDNGGKPASTVITADVVKALRARVLLEMRDFAGAYANAKELIESGTYALQTDPKALVQIWWRDAASKEMIMQVNGKRPDELPGRYGIFYTYINGNLGVFQPFYIPTNGFINLFPRGDRRVGFYFMEDSVLMGEEQTTAVMMSKFFGYKNDLNANILVQRVRNKPFRIAEQYLIAAEAAYKKGDESNAKAVLNTLLTARGLTAVTSSGDALFKEIQDERSRELAFEGFRLWDLRRWGLNCKRTAPQNPDILIQKPIDRTLELDAPATDPKFVWPIPNQEVEVNNKMLQNPGY